MDAKTGAEFTPAITNLYAKLCTHVHASTRGIGVDLRRFDRGDYIGFEQLGALNEINRLFAEVLDVSLATLFQSFDSELVEDLFVEILNEQQRWFFHRTRLVKSISSYFRL